MATLLLLFFGALRALPAAPSTARPVGANASAAPSVVEVRVGVLLPGRNLRYPWAWPRVAPALRLALEALEPQLRHAGFAVRTAFASTEDENGICDFREALLEATGLENSEDPDVLLGPGCWDPGYLVAHFAHYRQLPLLRAGLHESRSSSRDMNTTVYAGLAGRDLKAFEANLHQHFNWTSRPVVVISPEGDYWEYSLLNGEENGGPYPLTHRPGSPKQWDNAWFIQAFGRVVYILMSPEMLRDVMHLLEAQNMTNGDYVFFYVDILGESLRAEGHREAAKPWQSKSKDSRDMRYLREAFQTVLVITSHEPQTPEYQRFQSQVILRAQRDFGVSVNDSLGTLVAGCFHDVLLLYLRALNETLREGGTKRDTSRILEKMRGLKIQGVTGMVSIDSDNEREMDFNLWAMRDVESGEYQVVAHYVGSEKRIKWLGPIPWKKGSPPLDNPPCVYNMDGSSCGKVSSRGQLWACLSRTDDLLPGSRCETSHCVDPPGMDAVPLAAYSIIGNHGSLKTSDSVVGSGLVLKVSSGTILRSLPLPCVFRRTRGLAETGHPTTHPSLTLSRKTDTRTRDSS
ncbi:UNVERIFIED_CONTAM: hypothetical protein K2H54_020975 [Gekko kuhli]